MLKWSSKISWYILSRLGFTLILLMGIYASLGQYYAPVAGQYREQILQLINHYSSIKLDAKELVVSWRKLSPIIEMKDVTLRREEDPIDFLAIDQARASVNVLASIRDRGIRLDDLYINGVDLDYYEEQQQSLDNENDLSWQDIWTEFLGSFDYADALTVEHAYFSSALGELDVFFDLGRNGDFRRMTGGLLLNDAPLQFVVETQGSFRDIDQLRVKVHLTAADINFEKLKLDNVLANNPIPKDLSATTEVWFDWHPARGINALGSFSAPLLDLSKLGEDIGNVKNLYTNFLLTYDNKNTWDLSLSDTTFNFYDDFSQEALRIHFSDAEDNPLLNIQAPSLNLQQIYQVVKRVPALAGSEVLTLLDAMQPKGYLHSAEVVLPLNNLLKSEFQARLEDVSIQSLNKLPSADNISGLIKGSITSGIIHSASKNFVLRLPSTYDHPIAMSSVDGSFRWKYSQQNGFKLNSSLFKVTGSDGVISGYLGLDFPSKERQFDTPSMDLLLGATSSKVTSVSNYLPYMMDQTLHTWLDNALQGGDIPSAAILYRGSIAESATSIDRSLQLGFVGINSQLNFSQEWPVLENANIIAMVDDINVDVLVNSGVLQGINIEQANISARPTTKFDSWLSVEASFNTQSQNVIDLLLNSPVSESFADILMRWNIEGAGTGNLTLGLPLAGASTTDQDVEIDTNFEFANNKIQSPSANLVFNDVKGKLNYKHNGGLSAKNITANWLGQPVNVQVESKKKNKRWIPSVNGQGSFDVSQFDAWLNTHLFEFVKGKSDLKFSLTSDNTGPQLQFSSSLKGVESNLPEPLAKDSKQSLPLQGVLSLAEGRQTLNLVLADRLTVNTQLQDFDVVGSQIVLGSSQNRLPELPGVYLTGFIKALDVAAWQPVVSHYKSIYESKPSIKKTPLGFRNLSISQLELYGYQLDTVELFGDSVLDFWHIFVADEKVRGTVALYSDDRKPRVAMEYLDIAGFKDDVDPMMSVKNTEFWSTLKPSSIPNFDFSVDELRNGNDVLGAWSFVVRSEDNLLQLNNIVVDHKDVKVTTSNEDSFGAKFSWQKIEDVQFTSFEGRVSFTDLADVMSQLGKEPILTSSLANFVLDVEYPGSPVDFELENLQGRVDIELLDGMFLSASDSAKGAVNMTSLFDFGALVRRLRLDFSDMNGQGINYDTVYGAMDFTRGQMSIIDTIQIEGPSSEFALAGSADLVDREIDASLVAVLPLTGNISLITAATASLPAALGLYVVGKLFKPQLDKLSSVVYHITGSWDDPDIEFNKLFDVGNKPTNEKVN